MHWGLDYTRPIDIGGDSMSRTVSLFSCGAASAVATKLVLSEGLDDVVVVYNEVAEEHPDNKRFLADCEKWFGVKVEVRRNEKYSGSIYEVFRKERFIASGHAGAACSKRLKREINDAFIQPTDTLVFGYTAEEQGRLDRFIDANNGVNVRAPLIERGASKSDCLAIIERAGIELPMMYRLGYRNNNCIGCVKGGKGYWNKIRRDFPEVFERMAKVQDELGPGSSFWRETDGTRTSLRQLDPEAGRNQKDPEISCGVFCELVEIELN